ncbi:MAG: GxxExxY protein [Planctomycetota bacterium]|nr:GxxExxY protein [Planctomycetota bacterium]
MEKKDIDPCTEQVIGAAIEVHKALGPGLLESAYAQCLCRELSLREVPFRREVELPVTYKDVKLNCGYRIDVLVAECLVVEVKAVETVLSIHEAQLLTYLKLGGWPAGLLLNFNVSLMKNGVKRMVRGLKE